MADMKTLDVIVINPHMSGVSLKAMTLVRGEDGSFGVQPEFPSVALSDGQTTIIHMPVGGRMVICEEGEHSMPAVMSGHPDVTGRSAEGRPMAGEEHGRSFHDNRAEAYPDAPIGRPGVPGHDSVAGRQYDSGQGVFPDTGRVSPAEEEERRIALAERRAATVAGAQGHSAPMAPAADHSRDPLPAAAQKTRTAAEKKAPDALQGRVTAARQMPRSPVEQADYDAHARDGAPLPADHAAWTADEQAAVDFRHDQVPAAHAPLSADEEARRASLAGQPTRTPAEQAALDALQGRVKA